MKKLFLSMVALVVATMSYAQNTLVATLSHGDEVSMYYGSKALVNAVNAAESGDVITLSSGTFEKCDISKGITIRGAGAEGEKATIITGYSFTISIPQSDTSRFTLEGVSSPGSTLTISGASANLYFVKCSLQTVNGSSSANSTFVNCKISAMNLAGAHYSKLVNCNISGFNNSETGTSKADFYNCYYYTRSTGDKLYRSSWVNSIICNIAAYYSVSFGEYSSAMNCICIGAGPNTSNRIDCYSPKVSEVFASYENVSLDGRYGVYGDVPTTPELSAEAKATFLGTDGTEVGLYGGQYPYDLTPTYPLITKLNVAKQATVDNKLSVEIEVSATE